jgi:hypothetical protein
MSKHLCRLPMTIVLKSCTSGWNSGFVQRVGSFDTAARILLKFENITCFSSSAFTVAFCLFQGTTLGSLALFAAGFLAALFAAGFLNV